MTTDLDELERWARAATLVDLDRAVRASRNHGLAVLDVTQADAAFIAAARAAVLEMIAEVRRLSAFPLGSEGHRLDTMWQKLVRERDEAVWRQRAAEAIVRDLAAKEPDFSQVRRCQLCYGETHHASCPYRRSVEAMKR